jgi:hypothetical protein
MANSTTIPTPCPTWCRGDHTATILGVWRSHRRTLAVIKAGDVLAMTVRISVSQFDYPDGRIDPAFLTVFSAVGDNETSTRFTLDQAGHLGELFHVGGARLVRAIGEAFVEAGALLTGDES